MRHIECAAALVLMCALASALSCHGRRPPKTIGPPDPGTSDPLEGVFAAMDRAPILAMGDDHGNDRLHDLIDRLIRDPRLPDRLQTLVVEFGSAGDQTAVDRYVAGEDLDLVVVRDALRNTTQLDVWDLPMYRRFFATLREVNQGLPPTRRFRVLLGDPPIDWFKLETCGAYLQALARRDGHLASLLETEVLAKNRRALVLYGYGHLWRTGVIGDMTLPALIETRHPRTLQIIVPLAARGDSPLGRRLGDQVTLIHPIRGTWLGAANVGEYFENALPRGMRLSLEKLADAYLYLGTRESQVYARWTPDPVLDRPYFGELERRRKIIFGPDCVKSAP